jgi:hypothetical protein
MRKAADLMVNRGLIVEESSGWESRGRPYSFNPTKGVICHHTAADTNIDSVLINGRSDLPGPLCHYALHGPPDNGSVVLIAAGYANHAGESKSGYPSNSSGWGIECTGPIPDGASGVSAFPMYNEYIIMVQCICEVEGWPTDVYHVPGHKESCYPTGRKGDPYFDMNSFRNSVEEADGIGVEDMTDDEHKWLKAIYDAMVVPGSTEPSTPYENHYNLLKSINTALAGQGTTGPAQTLELNYRRIKNLETWAAAVADSLGVPFTPVDSSTVTG